MNWFFAFPTFFVKESPLYLLQGGRKTWFKTPKKKQKKLKKHLKNKNFEKSKKMKFSFSIFYRFQQKKRHHYILAILGGGGYQTSASGIEPRPGYYHISGSGKIFLITSLEELSCLCSKDPLELENEKYLRSLESLVRSGGECLQSVMNQCQNLYKHLTSGND